MKDVVCTRSDWINQGRDLSTLEICQYADGEEKYISIQGTPFRYPVHKAGYVIRTVQRFPTYLLEPSNRVIGDIMGRAFKPLAPPAAQVTLFWVQELQQCNVLKLHFKTNWTKTWMLYMLAWQKRCKPERLTVRFLKVRKSLAIFTNLWKKTFCRV